MLARVVAVGRRERPQRGRSGAPGDRRLQASGELLGPPRRDPPAQILEPFHVRVERRGAYPEARREGRERHGIEALGVGELGRGVGDRLRREPGAGHQADSPSDFAERAIAASIAAPGASATGPWPAARRDGSSARSAARRGQVLGAVRRRAVGEREAPVEVVRHFRSPVGGEDIARDQRAVAGVQERDVAGSVSRRGDHLEAADPLAAAEQHVGLRLDVFPEPRHLLAVDLLRARPYARVRLAQEHFDAIAEARHDRVEPAGVVAVAVGEGDAADLPAGVLCGADQVLRGLAAQSGVDQGEPVVLPHEVGVDEAEPGELDEVGGDLRGSHLRLPFLRTVS